MDGLTISPMLVFLVLLVLYVISSIQILNEYERAVVFRLGKLLPHRRGLASCWCSARSIATSA